MAKFLKLAFAFGLLALAASPEANAIPVPAVTMQATYRGTVLSGTDGDNVFGGTKMLVGADYVATFVYDSDIGRQSSPIFDQVFGGASFPNASPMRSANIKINGIKFSFSTPYYGQATNYNDGLNSYSYHTAIENPLGPSIFLYEYRDDMAIPLDLIVAYSVLSKQLLPPGLPYQGHLNFGLGGADLSIKSLNVARVSAVPLPAGLPLIATALMCLGLVARRKSVAKTRSVFFAAKH